LFTPMCLWYHMQYKLVPAQDRWCPVARKVTVSLVMHWPSVRLSGLSSYGLKVSVKEMSTRLYAPLDPVPLLNYCNISLLLSIFRLHHVCTQCKSCGLLLQMSHLAWSVCPVDHVREPCKNGWTDRDVVWGWPLSVQGIMQFVP